MKYVFRLLFLVISSVTIITSCESDATMADYYPEFSLAFSDGTMLYTEDVIAYDSSTHYLYLKEPLLFHEDIERFGILIGTDTIYSGSVQSCMLSSLPTTTHFITDCSIHGADIIALHYLGKGDDKRNDPRLIHAFESQQLLHHGLSCMIKDITIQPNENYSRVSCTVKVRNHDDFDYLILHPSHMGEAAFGYYTGEVYLQNTETEVNTYMKWSNPGVDWNNITLEDFSVLKAGETISFTFASTDYPAVPSGTYNVLYRFSGLNRDSQLKLDQPNGRIWMGDIISKKEYVQVN